MTANTIKMEKPKRPLSAYNLFYWLKRAKILEANKSGDDSKKTIHRIVTAVPGLEEQDPAVIATLSTERVDEISRNEIRAALVENMLPSTRNRSHRKTHGAMSFLEMNKIMCASWKSVGDVTRSVFEELAAEGRKVYHRKVVEYEKLNPTAAAPPPKKKAKTAAKPAGHPLAIATPLKMQQAASLAAPIKKAKTNGGRPLAIAKPAVVPIGMHHIMDLQPKSSLQARSSSPTPMKMSELISSNIVTPMKTEPGSNFAFSTTPRAVKNDLRPVVSPVYAMPSADRTTSGFDFLDMNLESGPGLDLDLEILPTLSDILDIEESKSNFSDLEGSSYGDGLVFAPMDPPDSFSPFEEGRGRKRCAEEVTADDFMQLIATLDESLAA